MKEEMKVINKIEEILIRQITEMTEVDVCAKELYDAIAKPRDLLIQQLSSNKSMIDINTLCGKVTEFFLKDTGVIENKVLHSDIIDMIQNVSHLTKDENTKGVIDFAEWYSGMDRHKVENAYKRYQLETLPHPTTNKQKDE